MSNLTQLRLAARAIFDETLGAVDAAAAVRRSVQIDGSMLRIIDSHVDLAANKPVYAIAIGKAAFTMASALDEALGEKLAAGILTNTVSRSGPRATKLPRWHAFLAGHPEPNEESLLAAQACFELLERANKERALIVFLVSGGGSAMIESPINPDITLADLCAANKTLVTCGASIAEINSVRRAFSSVKGGRLAAHAPDCDQITLIISDVPPGEERSVASGPTLTPSPNAPDGCEVIAQYNLRPLLPRTILRAIDGKHELPVESSNSVRKHFVLLDNQTALKAAAEAAQRRGFVTEIAGAISDQPIEQGCAALIDELNHLRTRIQGSSVSLISGGEFACPVRGDGIGGRNLESALRLALEHGQHQPIMEQFVALCAGTDGIDGNSPAAGAIVDSTAIPRALGIGLEPQEFLARSDSYSFFVALGEAVATGPTGTNVRDIRILLA